MKFKIGDLVTPSAAGAKVVGNTSVVGRIGIVVSIESGQWPIKVKWLGNIQGLHSGGRLPMKEYELKFAKNGVVPFFG